MNTIYKIKVFKAEPSVRKESMLYIREKKGPILPGYIMPTEREGSDGQGCADISEEGLPGGPIVADLYPELVAGCRRGCRLERDTPPPPSTHSA